MVSKVIEPVPKLSDKVTVVCGLAVVGAVTLNTTDVLLQQT